MRVSTWVTQINHTACQAQLFYYQKLVGVTGLGHLWRPRKLRCDKHSLSRKVAFRTATGYPHLRPQRTQLKSITCTNQKAAQKDGSLVGRGDRT